MFYPLLKRNIWLGFFLSVCSFGLSQSISPVHFTAYMDASRGNELNDSVFYSQLAEIINPEILTKLPAIDWAAHAKYTVKIKDGNYYAFRDCSFDVLHWKNDKWEKLNQSHNVGHNCDGNFILHKDTFLSIGNYGFWRKHSNIAYFDSIKKGWIIVKSHNQPIDYGSSWVYEAKDTLFSLFGLFHNASYNLFQPDSNVYFFDFNSRKWNKAQINMGNKFFPSKTMKLLYGYELKDYYALFYNQNTDLGFLIFNKRNHVIYNYKNPGNFFDKSPLTLIQNNTLYFQVGKNLSRINFEEAQDEYVEIGSIEFINHNPSNSINNWFWFLLLIVPLSIVLLLKWEKNRNLPEDPISVLIKKLLKHKGKTLKTEDLDNLLGIKQDDNPDLCRAHRARLIKEINQRYELLHKTTLIHRIKDKKDKRYILYQ